MVPGLEQFLTEFPRMALRPGADSVLLLRGIFDFTAQRKGGALITDAYALSIRIPQDFPADLPTVVELERKIPRDGNHHVNSDETLCLGAPLRLLRALAHEPTLIGFVHTCVVPYLYAVSHKLRFGGPFVFDELAHGAKGVLADYADLFKLARPTQAEAALRLLGMKKRRANKLRCPCGCGRRVGVCRLNSRLKEFRLLASRSWFRAQVIQIEEERGIQHRVKRTSPRSARSEQLPLATVA